MSPYQAPPPFTPPVDPTASDPNIPVAPPGFNGIPGAQGMPVPGYPTQPDPSSMQYAPETQQDGSVLLRVLNPDGTPGPVVKIIPPPMGKGKAGK